MKRISSHASHHDIENAIKILERFKKNILNRVETLLTELAKEGVAVASVNFSQAQYDGDNDVTVTFEQRGESSVAVVATGNATLFIEFGTGINYPDNHPVADEIGMYHGEYGSKLGALPNGWRYKGNPGTNGVVITDGKNKGQVHTYGNPANMSMYLSEKDIEQKFSEIVKRVFSSD